MPTTILPYPSNFPALLKDYCTQMGEAIRANRHHDTRRHLFLNFLRQAFGIDPVEVELEHKLKVGELHGRIDALYCHVIVEVKTDFARERDDAQRELKKYFASRARPTEYIGIGELSIRGYVIDSKTYYHYAKTEEEAQYLVGVLNTAFVNEAIKPLQPEGLMGARDIHRRPFEACNIPVFDPKNNYHKRIAKISGEARAKLLSIVPKMKTPAATARSDARHIVQAELNQLDELVANLLNGQVTRYPDHKANSMKLLELFEN